MNTLEFGSLQTAWEGINEFLFKEYDLILKQGGGLYGSEWVSYDNFVKIRRAWVDPEFDFGYKLGYNIRKWTSLVNNYVDFKYLDMIRAEISMRTQKKARNYNYSYHFDNSHGSGKDCLIACNFTKRVTHEQPIIIFIVRTNEVTKRLLFDFLLVQRLVEYVYGHNDAEVYYFAPSFYLNMEAFCMYTNHVPMKKLLGKGPYNPVQQKTIDIYTDFKNHPDPFKMKFKSHRRVVLQIQKDEAGHPLSGAKSMFAKDLVLRPNFVEYPEDTISKRQRRSYLKHIRKHGIPKSEPSDNGGSEPIDDVRTSRKSRTLARD